MTTAPPSPSSTSSTYAGNRANLAAVEDRRRRPASCSWRATSPTRRSSSRWSADADAVVNFAAESHVDRSILDPEAFLRTGVIGVHVLLEAVRRASAGRDTPVRFLQVSTDEVYGTLGADGPHWTEDSPIQPRSPYAAAKAAGELLVRSYVVTHGIDAVITPGLEHLRPVPAPREAHPAHGDQRPPRPAPADVRRWPADP